MAQLPAMAGTGMPAMAAFVSTPGLPPGAGSHSNYAPRHPQELRQYETLWTAASPSGSALAGAHAVQFFQRSGLDIQTLKTVWSLSTPSSTMSKEQFFTAMRLISMAQKHEPLSHERLQQLATQEFPAPAISGVQFAQLSGMSGATSAPNSYAFGDADLAKYQNLFTQYDTDHDGFVAAADAAKLFAQSGLSREALRDLWNLSVIHQNNKLNTAEFVVGMHLVVCVSKRNLPVPATLPIPLREYLNAADRAAPPQSSHEPVPAMDGAVRRGSFGNDQLLGSSGGSRPTMHAPESKVDASTTQQLRTVTGEIVDQARRGADAASALGASSSMAISTLSELVQKLKADKISLNATISSAESDAHALSQKLENNSREIDGLRREIDALRTRYRELQEQMMDDQTTLGSTDKEKEMLLREIDTARRQIEQLHTDKSTMLVKVAEVNTRSAMLEEQAHGLQSVANEHRRGVEDAQSDIQMLKALLAAYGSNRTALGGEVEALQGQLRSSRDRTERAERDLQSRQTEIERLRGEREQLNREKRELSSQLAAASSISSPTSVASAPVKGSAAAEADVDASSPVSLPAKFDSTPGTNKLVQQVKPSTPSSTPFVIDPFKDATPAAAPAPAPAPAAAPATTSPPLPPKPEITTDAFAAFPSDFSTPTSPASSSPKPAKPTNRPPSGTFASFGNDAGFGADFEASTTTPAASVSSEKPAQTPQPSSPFDSFGAFGSTGDGFGSANDGFGSFPDSTTGGAAAGTDAFAAFPSGGVDAFGADAFGSTSSGDAFGGSKGAADAFGSFGEFGSIESGSNTASFAAFDSTGGFAADFK